MQCPRTATPLTKVNVGKVAVYVSEKTGGVFLTNQTLALFESGEEARGQALARHLSQFHHPLPSIDARVNCPTCSETVMLRRYYSPLHVVEIDECPGCGGIWLDTGELKKLQSLMLNAKERAMLRQHLLAEHRPVSIEGMPHLRDSQRKEFNKIDRLLDLADWLIQG
ncbi:TFIIB-type zinc ribbon-containing protein [Alteromonas lipolytica]|uniref:Transcription factor zinc-finger domain-containing protein n=1 Tax=Alteromonas lipolytica TaxID=1856405 RepID=A0A1E8FKF1_9ALTE|nr:zf-TFIIB domain-containing protein [Alteromonas lipolytica]OFI36417.1 hypothetical protein BFC17_00615 [Alteromonas lipolytica]GGF70083.1 hypothetical protein GCM10011338_22780 [Alteromonas lipolytica]